VVGIATVARTAYPDPTQFDPAHKYFDPASNPADPRWSLVDVRFNRRLPRTVTLTELKARADELGEFPLVRKGNRLSVIPVTDEQWAAITTMAAGR
jgi:predicted RNA-binding protein with PUA-like domain